MLWKHSENGVFFADFSLACGEFCAAILFPKADMIRCLKESRERTVSAKGNETVARNSFLKVLKKEKKENEKNFAKNCAFKKKQHFMQRRKRKKFEIPCGKKRNGCAVNSVTKRILTEH